MTRIVFLSRLPDAAAETARNLLETTLGETVVLGPPHQDLTPEQVGSIEIAVVANPLPGLLCQLPRLRFIQSLWAGIDGLLADTSLPGQVPVARLVDPSLADAMAEAVVLHVLALHRQMPAYRRQQAARQWLMHKQPLAPRRRVGFLGLGEMARRSIAALAPLRFDVAGWSRRAATVDGVTTFHGDTGLGLMLARTDILVNLLPLTAQTRGILGAATFGQLPRGASIINFGRGGHQVPADIVASLDSGQLDHAVLDVFETEPLPADDPLWTHPGITVTPHVAATTDPVSAARCVALNIAAFRAGGMVTGLVDVTAGY